jgi:DNA repair protein RadD
MTERVPFPHQAKAIDLLRRCTSDRLRERRRVRIMLELATGAGKTFIAALIVSGARAKGKRVTFVVDAVSLIDQTVNAFFAAGIADIGVIQASHPMEDWSKPVQIASVQTLRSRERMPPSDMVIIDEAHCQDRWLTEIVQSDSWADVPVIGLSATPWSKGLGLIYDDLIKPVSMQELIDGGYLSRFRVFASSHPDLSGVKVVRGDFHEGQLAEAMNEPALIADVVDTYKRQARGIPAFCFCVDRAHAKALQVRFDAAGVGCGYIDAYTSREDREAVRRELDAGQISVVCNVGCLTKGVDWAIGCVILARPTHSEMLYVQMVGRGLRVNEGIGDCIILDHADNTLRMGFVTDLSTAALDKGVRGDPKAANRKEALPKECGSCKFLKPPKVRECPSCGFVPEVQSDVAEAEGELLEVRQSEPKHTMAMKQQWHAELNAVARTRGYSKGWISNTYRKKFGVWPRGLDEAAIASPSPEVLSFVTASLIRFSKTKRRAA